MPRAETACVRSLVVEPWIPVGAAALRRGVKEHPERVHVGRVVGILTGIGDLASALCRVEEADRAVTFAPEHKVTGFVGVALAVVVGPEVAGRIGVELQARPVSRLGIVENASDRGSSNHDQCRALLDLRASPSQASSCAEHIRQPLVRCGPYIMQ